MSIPSDARNRSRVEQILSWIGLPLALIVFAILIMMPTPPGLTVQGQRALAVFWLAFILWLTTPIPVWLTSMLAIALLALTGAWDYKQAFFRFGEEVIWLMVAAFMIASALERSGIGKRLAYTLAYYFGRKASTALLGLIILNFLLAFVVPSITARAALVLPIALLIAEAYGAKPGSRFGKLLMLQQPIANNLATATILTATAPQIIAWGFLKTLANVEVPWLGWFVAQLPITLTAMILMWIIGLKMWKPEVTEPLGGLEKAPRGEAQARASDERREGNASNIHPSRVPLGYGQVAPTNVRRVQDTLQPRCRDRRYTALHAQDRAPQELERC